MAFPSHFEAGRFRSSFTGFVRERVPCPISLLRPDVRRKKEQVRRFEPRFGVSQNMVDHEARYVAREVEDCCLHSLNELKQRLLDRRADWKRAHDTLEQKVRLSDERGQAAVQALLVRDCHHLFELYLSFVMSKIQSGDAPSRLAPSVEEESPQLPFSEWLFGHPPTRKAEG